MLARQRFQTEANGGWEVGRLRCLGPGVRWTFEGSVFEVSRKKTRLMLLSPFWNRPHLASEAHHAREVSAQLPSDSLTSLVVGASGSPGCFLTHCFFFFWGGAGLFYDV